MGNNPKFIEPIFKDVISGLALRAPAHRSSKLIPCPPPVVIFTTASVDCFIRGRNSINVSGDGVGLPSGLRACRCKIEAPASAAAIAPSAISLGVMGKNSDIVGV
jgi:hypothetical protein